MKHSIITWDCSFRNFFHTLWSLSKQDFPKNEFEMIVVEQRSRIESDAYNKKWCCPSLYETVEALRGLINIELIYLNESNESRYHFGKCLNAGVSRASGDIISTMDADTLLRPNFLQDLDTFHRNYEGVANILRRMA